MTGKGLQGDLFLLTAGSAVRSEQVAYGSSSWVLKPFEDRERVSCSVGSGLCCFTFTGGEKHAVFIELSLFLNLPSRTIWPSPTCEKFEEALWRTLGFEL